MLTITLNDALKKLLDVHVKVILKTQIIGSSSEPN